MGNVTIADLPVAGTLLGTELAPLSQAGTTASATLTVLLQYFNTGKLFNAVSSKSAAYTTVTADIGRMIDFTTAGVDLTLDAAVGGVFAVKNSAASGDLTLKSSVTIDGVAGATGVILKPTESCFVVYTGSVFLTFGRTNAPNWNMQVFTSSGTYSKPAGLKRIKVTVVGGGGGSGGAGSGPGAFGNGGGGGGAAVKLIEEASLASGETVTVGAGGAATAAGGTSSFGAFCSATGGAGGTDSGAVSSAGGVGSGGDLNANGGSGIARFGGASILGGSVPPPADNTNGVAGKAYGGGSSGPYSGTGVVLTGAAGAAGIVIVEEFT